MTKAPGFWLEDWEGEPQATGKYTREIGRRRSLEVTRAWLMNLGLSTELCTHGSDPEQLARDLGNSDNGNHAGQWVVVHGEDRASKGELK